MKLQAICRNHVPYQKDQIITNYQVVIGLVLHLTG